ncbi:unnamed protein product [Adineta ricciae]|uniref:Uncharacterized protein n=1 Tax=Adineta ricciae TaxID=249248 RepID=A0A816ARD1_ADIRI|nr:unnamed protein product [Adineta ricciae]
MGLYTTNWGRKHQRSFRDETTTQDRPPDYKSLSHKHHTQFAALKTKNTNVNTTPTYTDQLTCSVTAPAHLPLALLAKQNALRNLYYTTLSRENGIISQYTESAAEKSMAAVCGPMIRGLIYPLMKDTLLSHRTHFQVVRIGGGKINGGRVWTNDSRSHGSAHELLRRITQCGTDQAFNSALEDTLVCHRTHFQLARIGGGKINGGRVWTNGSRSHGSAHELLRRTTQCGTDSAFNSALEDTLVCHRTHFQLVRIGGGKINGRRVWTNDSRSHGSAHELLRRITQ